MKALKIFNTIAIGVPILLVCLMAIDKECLSYAMFSMVFTGVVQTIIAFVFWLKNRRSLLILIYFLFSALFFVVFYAFNNFSFEDIFSFKFWVLPILLCIYLSFIIYTSNDSFSEKN